MTTEPESTDKQITVAVPEDRVAEFYAFYGRFLAGFPHRRRRPRPHGCRSRHGGASEAAQDAAAPATREV